MNASLLLDIAAAASAQSVTHSISSRTPAASQETRAPDALMNPELGVSQSRPLFTIGPRAVVDFAPVQPH